MSCSSTRQTVPPPVPVPKAFSRSGQVPLPDRWWLSFNDPVLDRLIEQAMSNNLNLRIVWDRLSQAEAVARKAGALLWPTLDGQAGASRTAQRQPVTPPGEGRRTTYRTSLSLGLVAGYEVDLWGRIRSTKDAAQFDVRASAEQVQAAAITLSAQVAVVWYTLVEQYGQIDLLQQQLKINQNVLDLITLRFRRGQAGAADVLQQRQLVESRRGDLAAAESRAGVLEHQLAILLGQNPTAPVAERVTHLLELAALPATGVPAELIQQRPDIRQAYHNVLAADRRVAAAIADRFPRLALSAQANTSAQSTRDLFDNWLASLAANLVAPLFDGGERKAEVARTPGGGVRAIAHVWTNHFGFAGRSRGRTGPGTETARVDCQSGPSISVGRPGHRPYPRQLHQRRSRLFARAGCLAHPASAATHPTAGAPNPDRIPN